MLRPFALLKMALIERQVPMKTEVSFVTNMVDVLFLPIVRLPLEFCCSYSRERCG